MLDIDAVFSFLTAHAAQGDVPALLRAADALATAQRLMHIGPDKAEKLAALVRQKAPARVLELGAYFGYSALVLLDAMPPGARLTSLETDYNHSRLTRWVLAHAGVTERVTVVHARADEAIPHQKGPFDVVFIDHRKRRYLEDLQALEKHGLLAPGALIIADNVLQSAPVVAPYLAHVRQSGLYDSHFVPAGDNDGFEVSTRRT